jgi:hypothetical protein
MKHFTTSIILCFLCFSLYCQSQDTFKCYNANELRRIATRLIEKKQCDSILSVANEEITTLYDVIYVKDIIIYNTDSITKLQADRIKELETNYQKLSNTNNSLNNKQKWLLTGLLASLLTNIALILTK